MCLYIIGVLASVNSGNQTSVLDLLLFLNHELHNVSYALSFLNETVLVVMENEKQKGIKVTPI